LKVIKEYEDKDTTKNQTLEDLYGAEIAKELVEMGFKAGGFNPPSIDLGGYNGEAYSYLGVDFVTGAKGGAFTLPSVNAVKKKIAEGKTLTVPEKLMKEEIVECDAIVALVDGDAEKAKKMFEGKREVYNFAKRKKEYATAKTQFSVLLSNGWFNDIDSEVRELTVKDPIYGDIKAVLSYGTENPV
jgi:protein-tyrosine-phosphatase